MGVVYRAEDLRLGLPVALKLLPSRLARDPARQRLLIQEVGLGRRVTHPAVCRIHDIVEAEGGEVFATMELVEGEDLASLLRRVGRLPAETALRLLGDLCAGLAAAHGRSVLHRDLKPANVLVDSQGRARILDFGLATLGTESELPGYLQGTPAYMAPEVLRGGPPSKASDLFAVGLIAWEMLTGERLMGGSTLREVQEVHRAYSVPSLGGLGLAAGVSAILRSCLALDPRERPHSAREVLAALPGGDPLAAAMDAGETPSPELVAASAEVGSLAPQRAWAAILGTLGLLTLAVTLAQSSTLAGRESLPLSPEALEARGRSILEEVGWPAAANGDDASWWSREDALLAWRDANQAPAEHAARPAGSPLLFHYRRSPRPLVAGLRGSGYRVTAENPPPSAPGMSGISLDPEGRLVRLYAVPPRNPGADRADPAVADWDALFSYAGLDSSRYGAVPPAWTFPAESDDRRAWERLEHSTLEHSTLAPPRVEAAGWRGRAVGFELMGPWTPSEPAHERPLSVAARIALMAKMSLLIALPLGVLLLARRNIHRRQEDRRGAFRLFTVTMAILLVARIARADHVHSAVDEWLLLSFTIAEVTFWALMLAMAYVAVEPIARRRSPRLFIGWQRLLDGRWRDPMVGRDVLLGFVAGTTIAVFWHSMSLAPGWLGEVTTQPLKLPVTPLSAPRHVVYYLGWNAFEALGRTLGAFALLVLAQGFLRRRSLALVTTALGIGLTSVGDLTAPLPFPLVYATGAAILALVVLLRLGLLALSATAWMALVLQRLPFIWDPGSWFFGRSTAVLLLLVVLTSAAFWISLAGRSPFGRWRWEI